MWFKNFLVLCRYRHFRAGTFYVASLCTLHCVCNKTFARSFWLLFMFMVMWNETSTFLQVEDDLDRIRNAQNQQELMTSFKDFGRSLGELNDRAGRRQMVHIHLYHSASCLVTRPGNSVFVQIFVRFCVIQKTLKIDWQQYPDHAGFPRALKSPEHEERKIRPWKVLNLYIGPKKSWKVHWFLVTVVLKNSTANKSVVMHQWSNFVYLQMYTWKKRSN